MEDRQSWDPERYGRDARFVTDLGQPVVELLSPRAGERILDLGCGDGELTRRFETLGCHVVGVDGSPEQVAAARARGLDARVMDGQELEFENEFDGVFSNAALHWMKRADDVITGVWRALRPGGRFVGECGGHRNIATVTRAMFRALEQRRIDTAGIHPWYFPTPEDYTRRLRSQGFQVVFMALIPRPTELPGDLGDWLEIFAQSFLAAVPDGERTAFIEEVREALRPNLCTASGLWTVDYVRLRFAARKPAAE
jgi:trans-aconitate methyltransferase